jgi:protoheme IX farnesyltransferase
MAGWATATGSIDLLGFLVGWLVFMWTPPHFWCLAIRAREEYASVRVPMLPVMIGNQKTASYILANTAILLPYSVALYFFGLGLLYTVVAAVSGSLMLAYHYKLTKNPTPEFAWKAYKVTAPYLVVLKISGLRYQFHSALFLGDPRHPDEPVDLQVEQDLVELGVGKRHAVL